MSPESAAHLRQGYLGAGSVEKRRAQEALATLTDRERDVAALVAQERSNSEIAAALFISESSVKSHLANVQRKLGAEGRVGIATAFVRAQ